MPPQQKTEHRKPKPQPNGLLLRPAHQFARDELRRLAGERYEEIAASGGGIHSTVAATGRERDETLEKLLATRLERWRANGCTCVEVKSGYGLLPAAEMRLSRARRRLAEKMVGWSDVVHG